MNEDQYYNPIIQAMIHTAQLQKQGQQQEIEKQKNADELKIRQDAMKQAQKQFDTDHELRVKAGDLAEKNFNLQKEHFNLQQELAHVTAMADAAKFVKEGGDANKIPGIHKILGIQDQEQAQPTNFSPATGSSQIAPRVDVNKALFDPSVVLGQEVARVKALGGVKQQFDIEQEKRDLEDKKTLGKFQATLEKTDKQLDRESHERIARITADSRVKNPTINPQVFESLFKLKALGQIKLNPTNPTHEAVLAAMEARGYNTDVSDKDVDAIKETNKLGPIFDQLEEFTKKLPTGRGEALLQKGRVAATEMVGGSSDIQNDWKIARSRAVLIGRALEGMTGRPLAIQLKTDLDSLPEVGITKGDAQKRIANLKILLKGVEDSLTSGMPEEQKKMFLERYQGKAAEKPDFLKVAPKTNKSGHSLDEEMSIKMGQPVYK